MSSIFNKMEILIKGSAIQHQAYSALRANRILERLQEFNPVVAGTLPLDLFIAGKSDIDVICEAHDLDKFAAVAAASFSVHPNFQCNRKVIRKVPSIVARFYLGSFPVELFAQPIAVEQQWAYRHLFAEYRILQDNDQAFREALLELKKQGVNTEEAFARLLALPGDAFEALLLYAEEKGFIPAKEA